MKLHYLLFTLLLVFVSVTNAQFTDDMESYTDGQPISGDHWTDLGCGGGVGCAIMSTSEQARSGSLSGLIPNDGTTDAALDLGNKIFGTWVVRFYTYIPSNREAYWNMLGCLPICAEDWTAGRFFFNQNNVNPGIGEINNIIIDPVSFTFPHDEWFSIGIEVDISAGIQNATWAVGIDGQIVIPHGTPFRDAGDQIATSLGGINFFSLSSNNQYYLDDFEYCNNSCPLGVEEYFNSKVSITPNPVDDILTISSDEVITSIEIFNLAGKKIHSMPLNDVQTEVDLSGIANGLYIIKARMGDTEGIVKIVKQ
jgi:hypothetical protein